MEVKEIELMVSSEAQVKIKRQMMVSSEEEIEDKETADHQ
jgi:hypothetical protein